MRIAGLNLAEFLVQATGLPSTRNTQATVSVTRAAHSSDPKSVTGDRVIDAEILTKSVTPASGLEQRIPTDFHLESLVRRQMLDNSADQRVAKYLETQFDSDQSGLHRFSLDTYA